MPKEEVKLEDTNMALVGSKLDHAVKKEASMHEAAWTEAGKKPGLQVWRIEKFEVKSWPVEHYGKFFAGDSYIILWTYQARSPETGQLTDKLLHDVHFWLGAETTQDEAGTAAYKTVELDDRLDGLPVQYREVMGCESGKFNKLFQNIEIMTGGIETGFKHVEASSYGARLLHVKGKSSVRTTQVPLKIESLNAGDVFILDAGLHLWQWNGPNSSHAERKAANATIANIKVQRGSKPTSVILDNLEDDEKFWHYFGGQPTKINEASNDEGVTRQTKLLKMTESKEKPVFDVIQQGEKIDQTNLNSNSMFILDVGYQVYVWVGKNTPKETKARAMAHGTTYLGNNNFSVTTPIVRVLEGAVCPEFDAEFSTLGYAAGTSTSTTESTDESKKEQLALRKNNVVPPLGCVVVTVHEAKELTDVQLIGKQDPFCKVIYNKHRQRTPTHDNGNKEAKWTHSAFKFEIVSLDDQLVFEVHDENYLKNARIGDVAIDVPTLLTHTTPTTVWYDLQRKQAEHAGKVYITTQFFKPLSIVANEAKGLRSVQIIGKQDPYVRFIAGSYHYTTLPHADGSKTPKWTEQCTFTFNAMMLPADTQVEVLVKNDHVLLDRNIAYAAIPLSKLLATPQGTPTWFPLTKKLKKPEVPGGEICLTML